MPITNEVDVVLVRQKGRNLAAQFNFSAGDLALIATAISEIARNIIQYAGQGEVTLSAVAGPDRCGIVIIAQDEGPGIPDLQQAMQDGYSTGGGLGLGLPGAKRLMDEFEVRSAAGSGTTVIMKKWTRKKT